MTGNDSNVHGHYNGNVKENSHANGESDKRHESSNQRLIFQPATAKQNTKPVNWIACPLDIFPRFWTCSQLVLEHFISTKVTIRTVVGCRSLPKTSGPKTPPQVRELLSEKNKSKPMYSFQIYKFISLPLSRSHFRNTHSTYDLDRRNAWPGVILLGSSQRRGRTGFKLSDHLDPASWQRDCSDINLPQPITTYFLMNRLFSKTLTNEM